MTFIGPFRVCKSLGSGGFSEVFAVEDLDTKQRFAVKSISIDKHEKDLAQKVKSVQKEIEMEFLFNRKLNDDPFLLKYHYFFLGEGCVYFVMEYCSYGDFTNWMKEIKKELDEEIVISIFAQIVEGISHLHANGILHRDIKPENFLFNVHGEVKIADFGIAKDVSASGASVPTETQGTYGFVPAEVQDTGIFTAEADMFAVGCTAYFLMTRRLPFTGDGWARVARARKGEYSPIVENYSQKLKDIVYRLLSKDPTQRYTAAQLKTLPPLSAAFPLPARHPVPVAPPLFTPQRHAQKEVEIVRMKEENCALLQRLAAAGKQAQKAKREAQEAVKREDEMRKAEQENARLRKDEVEATRREIERAREENRVLKEENNCLLLRVAAAEGEAKKVKKEAQEAVRREERAKEENRVLMEEVSSELYAFRIRWKGGMCGYGKRAEDISSVCNDGKKIVVYLSVTEKSTASVDKEEVIGFSFGTYSGTAINNFFLYGCTSLTAPPVIPNTVTSIGHYFLSHCTSLTTPPIIPNTVTSIGSGFLSGCTSLTTLPIIPNTVPNIGDGFLSRCISLTTPPVIPNTVTSIGDGFLSRCTSLTTPPIIPNTVTSIGSGFLCGCTSLTTPPIVPNTVTRVEWYFLFGCTSLTTPPVIPNTVTSIDSGFLSGCTSLATPPIIPTTVTSIGYDFLSGCTSLTTPPIIPNTVSNVGSDFRVLYSASY